MGPTPNSKTNKQLVTAKRELVFPRDKPSKLLMNTNITNRKALPNQKQNTEVNTKDVGLIIRAILKNVSNPQVNQTKAL